MWPKGYRKKKQYTAAELLAIPCERAAQKILECLGQGAIIQIAPPDEDYNLYLGPIYPPGGGEITEWHYHRAVRIGDRMYDLITGPNGMPIEQYRQLFEYGDALVFRPLEELD